MAKQKTPHKYIFKINSTKLRNAKWNLNLPLEEARANGEIISLNDSQMLRWIDELNGAPDAASEDSRIRKEISRIKQLPTSRDNRRAIQRLYDEQNRVRFRKDYLHLIIDRPSDLKIACRGFMVNGIRFERLLGTNGGVKNSTIVFANADLIAELRRRIDNGRSNLPQIPAKLEAYRALTCSGTIPVSMPNGILVVPDCETKFKEDIIMLNDEDSDEPVISYLDGEEITLDESDGYGLMCPALAERWSSEVGLNYIASGMNTRNSWEKGMVFTFDFHDFADKVAGGRCMVKDAWGHEVDIRNVELILTTSMLKLWNCYDSIEHYLSCCEENHYTFGIAKTCPRELESRRTSNYQFIQSFNLTDEQVDELVQPTIDEIRGILSGDYRKALLFMRGTQLNDENVEQSDMDFANALMVEPRMYNDPYIRKRIYSMIEKRIDDAKIGVISLHANYSIVCGDPYALCQNIFELPVTGLLGAGQIYNKYWVDSGKEYVACFRAPMSCHNNVLKMQVANTEEMAYWYRHMTTCTMLNAWDTTTAALNGCDKDE